MPKAPEPSSTCQNTTKSLPRISPKSYCYNAVPNRFFSAFFNFSHKRPTFTFTGESGYTLTFANRIAHSGLHGETGAIQMGALLLPSERSARSQTSPGRVSEQQTLPLWGLGQGCSQRTQRAYGTATRISASLSRRRRGPAGLRDPFSSVEIVACMPCAQGLSACARHGRYHYPRRAFACCRNAGRPLVKAANLPFSEVG